MIYGNILPNKASVNRIMLKSILGVFIGGIFLSVLLLIGLVLLFLFTDLKNENVSVYEMLSGAGEMVIGAISWTLMFASVPAIFGGVLLSGVIYRDFRLGNTLKNTAAKKGALLGGLTGLITSLIVIFTVLYKDHFNPIVLTWTLPTTLIASLIGIWGGFQVHKEIAIDFSFSEDAKEISQ